MKNISLLVVLAVSLVVSASAGAMPYAVNARDLAMKARPDYQIGKVPGDLATPTTPSKCTPGTDTDGDCVADADDNCPFTANADQADANWDHIGDVCATDYDNDTVANDTDNCYAVANTDQADMDGDGIGDVCDIDRDGDGLTNDVGETANGTSPDDWDSDDDNVSDYYDCAKLDATKAVGIDCDVVTVVDNVPDNPTPNPDVNEPGRDDDGDGFPNVSDNCPIIFNPGQQDSDGDGIGDFCDMLPGRPSEVLFIRGGGGSGGGCALTAAAASGSALIDLLIALPMLAMALIRGRKSR
ncbi:MAG TPA: thrombospondin type 3 repeat-containing protein [bacterium]|nr:thrombospondin type 3 repeat-containing protein [bacterium]